MTIKTVVQAVANHLAKQRAQAMTEGHCRYRDADGRMCAIGGILPRELLVSELEGNSVGTLYCHLEDNATTFRLHHKFERAAASWLFEQMPEIDEKQQVKILTAIQGYHDRTTNAYLSSGQSYLNRLRASRDLSDSGLSAVIYEDLVGAIRLVSSTPIVGL